MKTEINKLPENNSLDLAVQQWFDLMLATIEYQKNKSQVINHVKEYGK